MWAYFLGGLLTGIFGLKSGEWNNGRALWLACNFIMLQPFLMAVCLIVILKVLPASPSTFQGSYASLMKSMFGLVKNNKILQNVFFACCPLFWLLSRNVGCACV